MKIKKLTSPLRGELNVPGDKSISHRAIMLGAISMGTTSVTNFLQGADCLSTISCFRKMGVPVEMEKEEILVRGKGLHGLSRPDTVLDVGNSGTTTRLLAGILAGQNFDSELTGDESIQSRPMKRIIRPLTQMGAGITSVRGNGCAPLHIEGRTLKGIHYDSPVASAQVKSCLLLAGLYADDITSVTEPYLSRNHSEIMLDYFGATLTAEDTTVTIYPDPILEGQKVSVPGDISSAAYFIGAALLVPGSEILIRNVGVNPTRNGILRVCEKMGGDITLMNVSTEEGEPTADILVRHSSLHGITIDGSIIPSLIDEVPVIAVLAAFAQGETVIKDAQELKVKESNRIDVVVSNLKAMGADVTATDDGMIIRGGQPLTGALIDTKRDHRIAMSFAVAGLAAKGETQLCNGECVTISYPGFYQDLAALSR
ncbi:3-phosphoshikimate 1-carboxyvinyltransferase [Lactonifactor longoviformis]|uniref:3-phosphoshikimate 1-carboxyvinyltransferase n=1 Tax=Lactonifactor longoviformis TaxID=341220 RepID=UPI00210B7F0D|nr:3-phosphoshikimate 1-carboxyvinyltransferase [Lactonifactor longoviformis]MCQ4670574.1 3-phosphoshikimate 1-carboxyvinyltransferase [Lactonifactor longoviformis]